MAMDIKEINKYKNDWQKQHKRRIPLLVSPEQAEQIKQAADAAGQSVNAWILEAIEDKLVTR